METKDLYKVLGLTKGASKDEIRRAYRKLAREHHPDANPEDPRAESRFKEIQAAYEVLSSPEKRREYDEGPRSYFGSMGQQGATRRTGGFSDLSDLFGGGGGYGGLGDIFGRSPSTHSQVIRGEDVTVSVNLKFMDAFNGVTTRVTASVEDVCGDCGGSGASPGTSIKTCPDCGGRGVKSRDQGFFAMSEACSRCDGEGVFIEKPCSGCRGGGRVRKNRKVTVRIPAGAKDGMKVRVPGRGSAGRKGGATGDLFVLTRVEEHPVFQRRGDDFVVDVPVSLVEAALGAEVSIPRPDGKTVRLRIPAGVHHGRQFKVGGAGAASVRKGGGVGDLIVRVSISVPTRLKKREREILEAFADERDEDVRASLFQKVEEAGRDGSP